MYHDILTVSHLLYVISPKFILLFSRLHWYYSNSHKSTKTNISSFVVDPDLPATQYFIADFIYQGYYMKFKSIELPSRSLRDQIPSGAVLCRSQSSIRLSNDFSISHATSQPSFQLNLSRFQELELSLCSMCSACWCIFFSRLSPYAKEIVDPLG